MTFVNRLWPRLPVLGRAVLIGVAAAAAGTLPWAAMVSANTRYQSALPWAVPVMAMYLWVYWRYLVRGAGWPQSTADARRTNARANALPAEAWGLALVAGLPWAGKWVAGCHGTSSRFTRRDMSSIRDLDSN